MTNPMVHPETPHAVIASGCTVGEGALWDHRNGTLLFVDVKNPSIWRYHPATDKHARLAVPERIGFVALTNDPDIVIAGFKTGLVRIHLFGGETQRLVQPEPERPGNRVNDGCVAPDGILYFGTMDDEENAPTGSFWHYDGHRLGRFYGEFVVTNGPVVSPDGRTIYTSDTQGGIIYAHDLKEGVPGEPWRFIRFEEGWGHPDGMAVDAGGYLWVCHWGGSRVSRFAPDGFLERIVPMPTAQVTKCAFGGPEMTTLYVTSAAIGRDREIDPMAGHVFAVETGIRGLEACISRA